MGIATNGSHIYLHGYTGGPLMELNQLMYLLLVHALRTDQLTPTISVTPIHFQSR